MNSYAFFTDSDSDLPFRFVDELELDMVYMPYMVDGKEYFDDLSRNGKEKEFFVTDNNNNRENNTIYKGSFNEISPSSLV